MFRVSISLNEQELKALVAMGEADCRHPRDELRYIFMQAARERGLLTMGEERGSDPEGDAAAGPSAGAGTKGR